MDSGSQKAARAATEAGGRRAQAGAPKHGGPRPALRDAAARVARVAREAGAMTLFHFGNCFALAYFPYFITYKCSGL